MSASAGLLENADRSNHFVQFYAADEGVLIDNVARFFQEGFRLGGAGLAVATAEHRDRILDRLGAELGEAMAASGQFVCLDAGDTLSRITTHGHPDAKRFDDAVGEEVRNGIARAGDGGLRVYGEMVGLLWSAHQYPAAIRLEQLWNSLRKSAPFCLYCAYPIDVFDKDFGTSIHGALLCAHTHLLDSAANGDLESALRRAIDDVLGHPPDVIGPTANGTEWAAMPKTEAAILWLRSNLPQHADAILSRARQYYHATAPA